MRLGNKKIKLEAILRSLKKVAKSGTEGNSGKEVE